MQNALNSNNTRNASDLLNLAFLNFIFNKFCMNSSDY